MEAGMLLYQRKIGEWFFLELLVSIEIYISNVKTSEMKIILN
jgi:hypothetical protein